MSFEPEIRRELQILLDDVKDCQFRPALDETETLVHSQRLPDVAETIRFDADQNRDECACNISVHHGYPCVHMLALLLAKGESVTMGYFNPRWFSGKSEPGDGVCEWLHDDMPSDDDIASFLGQDDPEESLPEIHAWNVERTIA
jgi:hypothetical protein